MRRAGSIHSILWVVCAVALLGGCTRGGVTSPATTSTGIPSQTRDRPTPPPIDVSKLTGRIVFSAGPPNREDVYSVNADGSGLARLTTDRIAEFDPAWSPDGTRIVYRRQSRDDSSAEIYLMQASGSSKRNLTHNHVPDWGPDWLPDGSRIVFNSGMGAGSFGLLGYVVRPDGSALRRLGNHYVEYPAWSPDGTRVAFMAQEPGAFGTDPDYNVFVMNADGTEITRLTDAPGEDGFPAWSPDGSMIAFSTTRDDCSHSNAQGCKTSGDIGPYLDIWIMDADGSNQHRLSDRVGQFATWSPDGRLLLFSPGLNVVRADGSGLTRIPVSGVGTPEFPDWTA
jgi:Tol biopolymer transport system component